MAYNSGVPQVQAMGRFSAGASRGAGIAHFSTVADNIVNLQFVDSEGNRARLPGLVGQTLLEVAQLHKVDLVGPCGGGGSPTEIRRTKDWTETTFGEGPDCFVCHVQIPKQYHHLLPELNAGYQQGLQKVWEEEVNNTSRLACQITLTKEMEGMIVYVPDMPPYDVI